MKRRGMRVLVWPCLTLLSFLLLQCTTTDQVPVAAPTQTEPGKAPTLVEERDLVYAVVDGKELRLDLIYPETTDKPLPLVVFIYGSEHSFHVANKANLYYSALEAAKRGYVAANITYRTTVDKVQGKSKYEFPAQVHDAKCAIRWLKANAGRYGIDVDRVGVVGTSSGGCLALMLGLTDANDRLEGECGDLSISSRVQAVVNVAGETDAVMQYAVSYTYYRPFLGGTPESVPDRYKAASPVTYVSADDPPVFTVVGGEDARYPQAELLDSRLKEVGVPHTLIVVPGVSHYLEKVINFAADGPMWEFLDRHLRNGG
jgi:acetyl esterase/lipase